MKQGLVIAALLLAAAAARVQAQEAPGEAALRTYCAACHQATAGEAYARISSIRKTPEGWLMTITRMQHVHHVPVPDDARDAIVAYLADTQGLAPAETAGVRYALERRPNMQDIQLPGELQVLCARCHSAARIALQRRDADEWLKHVNWHAGQWPTIEYQQGGRDRYWWQSATTEVPGQLGRLYPLHSESWRSWQAHAKADLSGRWLVQGRRPGKGDYLGEATITRDADGSYRAHYEVDYDDGTHGSRDSHALVYTGYEWRGRGTLGGDEVREVFAASEDGQVLEGRWFQADHSEAGADFRAQRAGVQPRLQAIAPVAGRRGSTVVVRLLGDGLAGEPDFGAGTHARVLSRNAAGLLAEVIVDAGAQPGYRRVSVGGAALEQGFAVYDRVDRVEVSPAFGIARVGGGKTDPVAAQFDAAAWQDVPGADGKPVALRLGHLPVRWSVEPFNEEARQAADEKFAGTIDAGGNFHPAVAGPNPVRKFQGNNTGNLSVLATLDDAGRAVQGKGHLIVTVQRWNTPPIY